MFKLRLLLVLSFVFYVAPAETEGQFVDEVGFSYLSSQFPNLENGSTLQVIQTEAPVGSGAYIPNTSGSEYTGKTIIDATGTNNGSSGHANTVATRFFGNTTGIAPGIATITFFNANDYINNQTGFNGSGDPPPQLGPIQNHSWIANGISVSVATNVLQRIDHMIDLSLIHI